MATNWGRYLINTFLHLVSGDTGVISWVDGIQVELPFNFDHCFRCRSYFDNLQIVFGSFWCFQNKDVLQITIIIILILLFLLAFRPGVRCC